MLTMLERAVYLRTIFIISAVYINFIIIDLMVAHFKSTDSKLINCKSIKISM